MSFLARCFASISARGDRKRDSVPAPEGVEEEILEEAFPFGKMRIALYRKEGPEGNPLPVALIVHGGGWVYGGIETYALYGKMLASKGFLAIIYEYPLAPRARFPAQLVALDETLSLLKERREEWGADLEKVFLVGDSAGASMALQYGIAESVPEHGMLYPLRFPLPLRGLVLNCGTYMGFGDRKEDFMTRFVARNLLWKDYDRDDPRLNPLRFIKKSIPPIFLLSAEKDFLLWETEWLHGYLLSKGIAHEYRFCWSKEGNRLGHVFHLDFRTKIAFRVLDEETEWMKKLC